MWLKWRKWRVVRHDAGERAQDRSIRLRLKIYFTWNKTPPGSFDEKAVQPALHFLIPSLRIDYKGEKMKTGRQGEDHGSSWGKRWWKLGLVTLTKAGRNWEIPDNFERKVDKWSMGVFGGKRYFKIKLKFCVYFKYLNTCKCWKTLQWRWFTHHLCSTTWTHSQACSATCSLQSTLMEIPDISLSLTICNYFNMYF